MDNRCEKVIIDKNEYDDLMTKAMKYSMVIQTLIDEAELGDSWDRKTQPLKFDGAKLNLILNLIEKTDYESKIRDLKNIEDLEKGDE